LETTTFIRFIELSESSIRAFPQIGKDLMELSERSMSLMNVVVTKREINDKTQ